MSKTVISLSLGSSSRDMAVHTDFRGCTFDIERIGVDGHLDKLEDAIRTYAEKVDVITLGGIDIHFSLTDRRYMFRDAAKLLKVSPQTSIVDGESFKTWVEPYFFQKVFDQGFLSPDSKVFFPLAANRLSLVQSMMKSGFHNFVFGDLIYDIGFPPIPLRSLKAYERCGRLAGSLITQLPFSWIYPVGEKQHNQQIKRLDLFEDADIIAGDFHNIYRYMPPSLKDKTIITNTVTPSDLKMLRGRNLKCLITFSQSHNGRTFGSNVMDGVITAFLNKKNSSITRDEYLEAVEQLGLEPEIRECMDL